MAPRVHIKINHFPVSDSGSAITIGASLNQTNPIITDSFLDGDVVISMNNFNETIDRSAIVEVTFEGKTKPAPSSVLTRIHIYQASYPHPSI